MDSDTIFPALTFGEQIIGKYRWSTCSGKTETISIITNLRLLVRWRQSFFCCFHQSTYSAIALSSITRVDEARPARNLFIASGFLLVLGIILIAIATSPANFLGIIGIICIVSCIIPFIVHLILSRRKYITLKGNFGSIMLTFSKQDAREFEARISEMIYRVQLKPSEQQRTNELQPSTHIFSTMKEKKTSSTGRMIANNNERDAF